MVDSIDQHRGPTSPLSTSTTSFQFGISSSSSNSSTYPNSSHTTARPSTPPLANPWNSSLRDNRPSSASSSSSMMISPQTSAKVATRPSSPVALLNPPSFREVMSSQKTSSGFETGRMEGSGGLAGVDQQLRDLEEQMERGGRDGIVSRPITRTRNLKVRLQLPSLHSSSSSPRVALTLLSLSSFSPLSSLSPKSNAPPPSSQPKPCPSISTEPKPPRKQTGVEKQPPCPSLQQPSKFVLPSQAQQLPPLPTNIVSKQVGSQKTQTSRMISLPTEWEVNRLVRRTAMTGWTMGTGRMGKEVWLEVRLRRLRLGRGLRLGRWGTLGLEEGEEEVIRQPRLLLRSLFLFQELQQGCSLGIGCRRRVGWREETRVW